MEEKIYLIKAYEATYRGLHGIVDYVIEKTTCPAALDDAREMSYEVMESYGSFYEDFVEAARSEDLEGNDFDNYIDECYEENVAYEIYEVIGRGNEDIDKLNKEMAKDPDAFIKNYCKLI